jgi:nucleotide sugar dehydrogenase
MDWNRMIDSKKIKMSVFGMGYVGLPTALGFAEKGFHVTGVDTIDTVVKGLNQGVSHIEEIQLRERLTNALENKLFFATTDGVKAAEESDVSIICVPTPVTDSKRPDLTAVLSAGHAISRGLAKDNLVVLESTVHPTCTETELKPVLEASGLEAGTDFGLAYVPERYNPGDPAHTVDKVVRVAGAINDYWLKVTKKLYKLITKDVYGVKDLRTAEAAKIIENVQRDLNIALMNELALIFERMGVDVYEVIDAAATKWNFVKYLPGIGVGGHCLPVDPYYLTFKAQQLNFHPRVILSGRAVNDSMPFHTVDLAVEGLNRLGKAVNGSKIAVLGLSYKKNTGDIRNAPSKAIIRKLRRMKADVYGYDPFVTTADLGEEGAAFEEPPEIFKDVDCIILATAHDEFQSLSLRTVKDYANDRCVIVDGSGFFERSEVESSGFEYLGVGRGG